MIIEQEVSDASLEENAQVSSEAKAKEGRLRSLFQEMGSVVVAFSGGVDSSYVAHVATEVLGERALCITGESASLANHQRTEAAQLAEFLPGRNRELFLITKAGGFGGPDVLCRIRKGLDSNER